MTEPAMALSELLEIHKRLDIPLEGTFVLNRGQSHTIPEVKITHQELFEKLDQITTEKSVQRVTTDTLNLCWIQDNEALTVNALTFSALEASDSYVVIPLLRFIKYGTGTMIEPVILFSASCDTPDTFQHNMRCLQALERLEQRRAEDFWPDHIHNMISEALMRLTFMKQNNTPKLGGLYE